AVLAGPKAGRRYGLAPCPQELHESRPVGVLEPASPGTADAAGDPRLGRLLGGNVDDPVIAVRASLPGSPFFHPRGRQVVVGQGQRLPAVEVDADEVAGEVAGHDTDAIVRLELVGFLTSPRPVPFGRAFLARLDARQSEPAVAVDLRRLANRLHGDPFCWG